MNPNLHRLLCELEDFGQRNDSEVSRADRAHRMLNISRDTGEFLGVLIRATQAQRVLEIGTSNGYSTLWLGWAARAVGGHVTTVELAPYKIEMARVNVARADMDDVITQVQGDAGEYLTRLTTGSVDLLFLDSHRPDYLGWWPQIRRVLRPGGLLVVDNAVSHAEELRAFTDAVWLDNAFTCCTVPVGNGEFMATFVGEGHKAIRGLD